jgi:acetoin utilization deacetylase AcuC-like enzyme
VKAFYCDHFVLPLPEGHRFPMDKYRRLRERVIAQRIVPPDRVLEPAAASWETLARIHTPEYLEAVATGSLSREMQRRIGFPWSPAMVERARRSVGGTLAAIAAAFEDGTAANLAGGTHHAFADGGNGYCVFNDVAVACADLLASGRAHRPLVVDLDVHQGDGTAHIFRDEPRVFTLSVHGERNYPFRKQLSDCDVPLPDGTGDAEYLTALETHLLPILERHQPDAVFYLAGADAYEGDRLGRLTLTIEGLRARDRLVLEACRRRGLPVAVVMGGGYAPDIDAIVTIHANTIAEAANRGRDSRADPATCDPQHQT